jgi:hypothetical protein
MKFAVIMFVLVVQFAATTSGDLYDCSILLEKLESKSIVSGSPVSSAEKNVKPRAYQKFIDQLGVFEEVTFLFKDMLIRVVMLDSKYVHAEYSNLRITKGVLYFSSNNADYFFTKVKKTGHRTWTVK